MKRLTTLLLIAALCAGTALAGVNRTLIAAQSMLTTATTVQQYQNAKKKFQAAKSDPGYVAAEHDRSINAGISKCNSAISSATKNDNTSNKPRTNPASGGKRTNTATSSVNVEITGLIIANLDDNNDFIGEVNGPLYADDINKLYIACTIDPVSKNVTKTLRVKLIKPDGTVFREMGKTAPAGYSSEEKVTIKSGESNFLPDRIYGRGRANEFPAGTYTYEAYFDGRKVYTTTFDIDRGSAGNSGSSASNNTGTYTNTASNGASAEILASRIGVTDNDGESCFAVSLDFTVDNCKGKTIKAYAIVKDDNGSYYKYNDKVVGTVDNSVPEYDSSKFTNVNLYIPVSKLGAFRNGKMTVEVSIDVDGGGTLAQKDIVYAFDGSRSGFIDAVQFTDNVDYSGEKCLKVNIGYTVQNCKNRKTNCYVFALDNNGSFAQFDSAPIADLTTNDVTYTIATFSSTELYIPYRKLEAAGLTGRNVQFRVIVDDDDTREDIVTEVYTHYVGGNLTNSAGSMYSGSGSSSASSAPSAVIKNVNLKQNTTAQGKDSAIVTIDFDVENCYGRRIGLFVWIYDEDGNNPKKASDPEASMLYGRTAEPQSNSVAYDGAEIYIPTADLKPYRGRTMTLCVEIDDRADGTTIQKNSYSFTVE